ncbi:hypothetical protein [Lentilactobacillus sp. Marseille-Q4993]|uniref:hypothetical protein n=1 Tax=Lentilactobacillus sp. Marseille-Q4993 TaxID=3039492 RepID=UPI0024BCB20D|nr:hypothetical protein [Lentilactobacillus sp. Marseille-Q4993]
MKKRTWMQLTLIAIISGGVGLSSTTSYAKSKDVTTPKSIRGNWYHHYKNGDTSVFNISKYYFKSYQYHNHKVRYYYELSGKKHYYKTRQLVVQKDHGKWLLSQNGTDAWTMLKAVKYNGKQALADYKPSGGGLMSPLKATYYYHK